ncbi:MAG: CpsD/CapB family tyrosine-protein kinase [Gammaproteobacteria bacterium]
MNSVEVASRPLPASKPPPSERKPLPSINVKRIDRHLVSLIAPDSFEAEQYRRLRHVLEEMRQGAAGIVIAICSPIAGDGKTMTAINLAGALAQDQGLRVLLMDCDLRRQSETLRRSLTMRSRDGVGLTDAVSDTAIGLTEITQPLPGFNLAVVLAGDQDVAPYESLNSRKFAALIQEARQRYDYIILDAPPVIPVSDCALLASQVDGFLMVVSAHHTPKAMVEEALGLLDRRKLLGLIFNCSDQVSRRYYGYGDYYRRRRPPKARNPDIQSLPPRTEKV